MTRQAACARSMFSSTQQLQSLTPLFPVCLSLCCAVFCRLLWPASQVLPDARDPRLSASCRCQRPACPARQKDAPRQMACREGTAAACGALSFGAAGRRANKGLAAGRGDSLCAFFAAGCDVPAQGPRPLTVNHHSKASRARKPAPTNSFHPASSSRLPRLPARTGGTPLHISGAALTAGLVGAPGVPQRLLLQHTPPLRRAPVAARRCGPRAGQPHAGKLQLQGCFLEVKRPAPGVPGSVPPALACPPGAQAAPAPAPRPAPGPAPEVAGGRRCGGPPRRSAAARSPSVPLSVC